MPASRWSVRSSVGFIDNRIRERPASIVHPELVWQALCSAMSGEDLIFADLQGQTLVKAPGSVNG